jgi:DNA invertase Pin-like site-specific DNA recombinase
MALDDFLPFLRSHFAVSKTKSHYLTKGGVYETDVRIIGRTAMGQSFGYARISTGDQDLSLQIDDLKTAGCEQIYTDKVSGRKNERPGLDACLKTLRPGDTLVVWRLDRLGRSMQHLVSIITELKQRSIGFRSLRDGSIDTTTASGEMVFHIFAALAQFEAELIRERTRAGLLAARARGRKGGRKRVSTADPIIRMAKRMHEDRSLNVQEICLSLKISRATYYRYVGLD